MRSEYDSAARWGDKWEKEKDRGDDSTRAGDEVTMAEVFDLLHRLVGSCGGSSSSPKQQQN